MVMAFSSSFSSVLGTANDTKPRFVSIIFALNWWWCTDRAIQGGDWQWEKGERDTQYLQCALNKLQRVLSDKEDGWAAKEREREREERRQLTGGDQGEDLAQEGA